MSREERLKIVKKMAANHVDLFNRGFTPAGDWSLFSKRGKVYDFSAADMSQLDRIEREGLFVVEAMEHPEGKDE